MSGPAVDTGTDPAVYVGHLRTGVIRAELADVQAVTLSDGLDPDDVAARLSVLVPPGPAGRELRAATHPGDAFVAVADGGRVLWAGPLWGRRYRAGDGVVDLAASGLWSVFDRRWCVRSPALPPTAENADVELSGVSLRAVAAHLVRLGMVSTRPGGTDADLPVDRAALDALAGEEGTHRRTYRGYDLATVGERLRQLSQVDNGPDLHFSPRFGPRGRDRIEWALRAGDPALGQAGAPWVWEAGANLHEVATDEDGGTMASLVLVPGEGSERDKLVGVAYRDTLQRAGWSAVHQVVGEHTSTRLQATLDGYATEYARARHHPTETWTATVDARADPAVGRWQVGDHCLIVMPGDGWLTGDAHPRRIVGWNWSGGGTVALTLAATPAQID